MLEKNNQKQYMIKIWKTKLKAKVVLNTKV